MLLICCYLSHQPARCLQFSCFCYLLTPVKRPGRGFQRYPQLALRATVQQDKELLPTSVSGNICLQVPECFAFQPSTCTRADNDLQFLAAILTSVNGATSRGYAVTVILMSKHPGGVLHPLLASCLSPHRSVLPSGGSPEMLCLPAGHPFKVSGSSGNLTLEEPHFQLLTLFTFIQTFTTIPPAGRLPEVSGYLAVCELTKKMSLQ